MTPSPASQRATGEIIYRSCSHQMANNNWSRRRVNCWTNRCSKRTQIVPVRIRRLLSQPRLKRYAHISLRRLCRPASHHTSRFRKRSELYLFKSEFEDCCLSQDRGDITRVNERISVCHSSALLSFDV